MLLSMTGFGRALQVTASGSFLVEIQSTNRKHLEIVVALPPACASYEGEIRRHVAEKAQRGHVAVKVQYRSSASSVNALSSTRVNVLKQLKAEWQQISVALGEVPEQVNLPFLAAYFPEVMAQELVIADADLKGLKAALQEAMVVWIEMRRLEGAALCLDLRKRLEQLGHFLEVIEKEAPGAVDRAREKWREKLHLLFSPGTELEERLLKEVALFAERVDISEEIVRFRSHLKQFNDSIYNGSDIALGKKMEFLLQEMSREVNTMGSKSSEISLIRIILEMKGELEKIREQLQNVE